MTRPWWDNAVAVLDFETTDVAPETCMPVEMSVARFECGELVQSWATLINPGCPISEGAVAVHGISAEMVQDAPDFATAWATACDKFALADAVPCAYNAPFDRAILHRLAPSSVGNPLPILDQSQDWLDPLVIIRDVDKFERGKGRHKLEAACTRRGITIDGSHRALADAEACGRLLFALKERIGNATISELLRKQAVRAEIQEREHAEWKAKQPPLDEQGRERAAMERA